MHYDGVDISPSAVGGSGVSIAWDDRFTKKNILGLIVHELAHHFIGGTHPHPKDATSTNTYRKWSLMNIGYNKIDGFSANAFESWILGWSDNNITFISSDQQVTLDDFLSTGESIIYQLPGKDYEFLGIENRQKVKMFDDATVNNNDKGLFVAQYNIEDYYNTGGFSYESSIRVYSSRGRFSWSYYDHVPSHWNPNQEIPAFEILSPNPINGKDEFSMHYSPPDSDYSSLYAINPLLGPVEKANFYEGEDIITSFSKDTRPLFASNTNPAPSDWAGNPINLALQVVGVNSSEITVDIKTNYDPHTITESTTWDGQIFLDQNTKVENNHADDFAWYNGTFGKRCPVEYSLRAGRKTCIGRHRREPDSIFES